MAKSKVAVLKVTPETVLAGIARACELGGMRAALVSGRATVLQDDLSWRFPFPAANTTPWQLEGTILALRAAGFEELACVRGETAMARALEWSDPSFGGPVCDAYGVPLLHTFKDDEVGWALHRPKARMHVLGRVFPDGIHVPDVLFGKNAVQLPTMKTHVTTSVAGAMKCAFGGTLPRDRHRANSSIHKALVDVLAIQREIHTGLFAVMDGTTAGSGPGPRTMTPVVKDYVLAGADPVALDAVAAKMMGFDPMALEYIRLAHEDRLGVGDPRDIDIVGDDAAATDAARRESWGFQVGSNGASVIGDALAAISSGPLRRFETFVFGGPLRGVLAAGNEAYHDLYRWQLKDRRTFESWKRETAWGRLFAAYERGEADRVTGRAALAAPAAPAHRSATPAHL
jgi:uncharacterized protein (DUF362 family)